MHKSTKFTLIVWISIFLGLVLYVIPLPELLSIYRPHTPALVMMYWAIALPHRFGIGKAWLLGLLLDVLTGETLGQHALALAVMMYLTLGIYLRMRNYALIQQSLLVALLIGSYEFVIFLISGLSKSSGGEPVWQWSSMLGSALLWPVIYTLLRSLRRKFHG